MKEIVKHINDTNASFRKLGAGDAKNTDLFLDNEHYELFSDAGEAITVRLNKQNLTQAILFIASILPRKYDNSAVHKTVNFSSEFVYEQLAILDGFFTLDGKTVESRTQVWNPRKDVLKKNGEIDNRFYFNGLLSDVVYKDVNGIEKTAKFTIRNYLAGGFSDLHIKKLDDGTFEVSISNTLEYYNDHKEDNLEDITPLSSNQPLQQIYFGAPGTGKSYRIKDTERYSEYNSVRTTFHPDSDYSTFVGCYKPVKQKNKVANVALEKLIAMANELTNRPTGDKVKHIIDFVTNYASALCNIANTAGRSLNDIVKNDLGFSNDTYLCEVIYKANDTAQSTGEITYEFVPQAFTTAYVNAWKNLDKPYYLVIEEINRGNCAQIFGDIFQLLDRDSNTGYSSYKITPDKDLQDYLATALKDCDIEDEEIKRGRKMQLPSNLNILATMNTSDQSLFPIDSAFKRRWDWKYIPIDYTDNGHYITCGSNKYKWTEFLDAVNKRIESVTQSEDKKMGGWFVKPDGKEITADKFVSKVVFYLWNDVFKDFGHDGNSIFKEDFDKFHKFFDNKGDVKLDVLEKFLVSLGLSPIVVDDELQDSADNFEADYDETIDSNPKSKNDNSKYSINGLGVFNKGEVAFEAVKAFAESHTELSADEIIRIWTNLGIGVSNLVISEETYNRNKNKTQEEVTRFERRFNMLTLNDESHIYVTKGFTLDTITQFKDAVNKQTEWNIHIERIS